MTSRTRRNGGILFWDASPDQPILMRDHPAGWRRDSVGTSSTMVVAEESGVASAAKCATTTSRVLRRHCLKIICQILSAGGTRSRASGVISAAEPVAQERDPSECDSDLSSRRIFRTTSLSYFTAFLRPIQFSVGMSGDSHFHTFRRGGQDSPSCQTPRPSSPFRRRAETSPSGRILRISHPNASSPMSARAVVATASA